MHTSVSGWLVSMLANMLNIDPNQGSYKYYQESKDAEENRIERISVFVFSFFKAT